MWSYCRMVYLPMSYLYGKRFVGPITSLILQLRKELYLQPYEEINWMKVRHLCAKVRMLGCIDISLYDFLSWKRTRIHSSTLP